MGTDLGGLVYAALAAKSGYRVCVLGQGETTNTYRHEGHLFMRGPEYLYGFGTSPVIAKVFSELSLGMELKNRPQTLDPTLQLVLPDMRLDFAGKATAWHRELERELSERARSMLAFERWAAEQTRLSDQPLLADLIYPPSGLRGQLAYRNAISGIEHLLDQRKVAAALSVVRLSTRLRTLLEAPLTHLSNLVTSAHLPLATVRLWTHMRAGVYRLPEGIDGLKASFIQKVREQCGDYRPEERVEKLVFRRGRVREVELTARGETLSCEVLVGNMDPRQFFALVPSDKRITRYHAAVAGEAPAAWRVQVNVAVDPRVIPDAMAYDLVAVADPSAPLVGANNIWVSRAAPVAYPGQDSRPSDGVLSVSALMPARGIGPTVGGVQKLERAIVTHLGRVIPWLDEHLFTVHTPALVVDSKSRHLVLDQTKLVPIYSQAQPQTLGLCTVTPETAYRNVLLAGDAPFGALGFEGSFLAALQALALTRRIHRVKRPLSP